MHKEIIHPVNRDLLIFNYLLICNFNSEVTSKITSVTFGILFYFCNYFETSTFKSPKLLVNYLHNSINFNGSKIFSN